jgi:zinc protease
MLMQVFPRTSDAHFCGQHTSNLPEVAFLNGNLIPVRCHVKRNLLRSVLWICLLALAAPAFCQTKLPKIEFTDTKLENGLRVIIAPDHFAPVFSIDVTYNTGSANEKQGRTGFAHLFEHMMFQGSQNIGKGEHMFLVQNYGGSMNGTTNEDRTTYFEELPKNQLDLALFLEADRMKALNITPANLENQRNAVQEERRLRLDNQPYGKSFEALGELAFDSFPYHHSVIGSMEDLNAATIDDVKEFFRIYYAPNNAVLVLVGDLDPKEALAKVKKYFGDIPRQPAPPEVNFTEPDHEKERVKTINDPLARLPQIFAAYNGPKSNTPDAYALQVLGQVLSTGRSSRFYEHLVHDKQIAINAFGGFQTRRGPSLFLIGGVPRPGVKVEDLQKALDEELEAVKKNGITAQELEKVRTQILRQQIQTRNSTLFTAVQLGQHAVYYNDPNLINTAYDKFMAVTAEQVKQAAQKYLVPEHRAVVITMPAAKPAAAGMR